MMALLAHRVQAAAGAVDDVEQLPVCSAAVHVLAEALAAEDDSTHRCGSLTVIDRTADRSSRRGRACGRRCERRDQADDAENKNGREKEADEFFHAPMVLRGAAHVNWRARRVGV